jgi:3-methyladenine DNA glycosylase AlkD
MNPLHKEILTLIKHHSGKPTHHTFLDSYLGNSHPRYPISMPELRKIAKAWMTSHRHLTSSQLASLLTSLIKGKSSTEKCMVGILLDYSTLDQRKFNPALFNSWLNHLEGWAEVDSLCTGRYSDTEILSQWKTWKSLLTKFAASKNIQKRRASLVLLCSPLRKLSDKRIAEIALQNVSKLSHEKEILITKAISWVLRSMIKQNRPLLEDFLSTHQTLLPKIAWRETMTKLQTGTKQNQIRKAESVSKKPTGRMQF